MGSDRYESLFLVLLRSTLKLGHGLSIEREKEKKKEERRSWIEVLCKKERRVEEICKGSKGIR